MCCGAAVVPSPHIYIPTIIGVLGVGIGGGQALSAVASGFLKADAVVAVCPIGHEASKVAAAMRTPTLVLAAGEGSAEVRDSESRGGWCYVLYVICEETGLAACMHTDVRLTD